MGTVMQMLPGNLVFENQKQGAIGLGQLKDKRFNNLTHVAPDPIDFNKLSATTQQEILEQANLADKDTYNSTPVVDPSAKEGGKKLFDFKNWTKKDYILAGAIVVILIGTYVVLTKKTGPIPAV